jgi:opacity protein-like surface antigen
MKCTLAATCLALLLSAASAPAAPSTPEPGDSDPAAGGSVFADLIGLGYDLGKFHPDAPGRPYR